MAGWGKTSLGTVLLQDLCASTGLVPEDTERERDQKFFVKKHTAWDFPGGAVVENLPANAGDTGLSPGPGGSHMLRSS